MRTGATLLLFAGLVGCANRTATPPPATAGAGAAERAEFDARLALTWPAALPTVNRQVIPMEAGDHVNYTAMYADKRPEGVVVFTARIDEYPAAMWAQTSPEEILESTVFAFRKNELSRMPVAHGPRKYPGFDILSKRDDLTTRKLVVVAKPRVYAVTAASKDAAALTRPEVVAFFDSFTVRD
jgi:hypothetical protein